MSLADCPRYFFDLVFPPHASHLALRLYKCNNRLLNTKLQSITRISLEHSGGFYQKIPRFISELPSVASLSVAVGTLTPGLLLWPSVLESIPKSINSLELHCDDSHCFLLHGGSLPPTQVPKNEIPSDLPPLIDLSAVFPHLTTLKLRIFEKELLRFLPSTLTHLSIGDTFNLPFMSLLPRSLEIFDCKIEVFNEYAETDFQMDDFLSDLTLGPPNMRLPQEISTAISTSPTLFDPIPFHWTSKLPEGLEYLEDSSERFPPQLLAAAPRSLTQLELMYLTDWPDYLQLYKDKKSGGANDYWSIWPPSLLTLDLSVPALDQPTMEAIPKSLTKLTIHLDGKSDEVRIAASQLPPHLTSLALAFGRRIDSDLYIDGVLPSSLHHLRVSGLFEVALAPKCNLPPSITSLNLETLKTLSGAISPLPIALIKIVIRKWETSWFSLLPRTVASIEIASLKLSDDDIKSKLLFDGTPEMLACLSVATLDVGRRQFTLSEPHLPDWPVIETIRLPKELKVSSADLRRLPRLMQVLNIGLEILNETDLQFTPLASYCNLDVQVFSSPSIAEWWPLVAIRSLPSSVVSNNETTLNERFNYVRDNY